MTPITFATKDRTMLGRYAKEWIPFWNSPFDAQYIGFVRNRVMRGVIVFHDFFGAQNAWVSIGSDSQIWCSRESLTKCFSYYFDHLGMHRMSIMTQESNIHSQRLCQRLGFIREGMMREYFASDVHGVLFGMLRRDCKLLNEEKR